MIDLYITVQLHDKKMGMWWGDRTTADPKEALEYALGKRAAGYKVRFCGTAEGIASLETHDFEVYTFAHNKNNP